MRRVITTSSSCLGGGDAVMKIEGMAQLRAALAAAGARGGDALASAMVDEADIIMEESKRRAPVDLGTLRASGVVLPPQRSGGSISIEMGYGGAASDYALRQHEETGWHHTVGEAKYLERPVLEHAPKMAGNLAKRVRNSLERPF